MIDIETITLQNLSRFKIVRLNALREDPHAFGSTYERESRFTEGEWVKRLERWNGVRGEGFIAFDNGSPCGLAGVLLDESSPKSAELVSMWTAPTHRQSGVGRLLVNRVIAWAGSRDVSTLLLLVTNTNAGAIRFYEKLGFTPTGRTEPYPNDPTLTEIEMARPIP